MHEIDNCIFIFAIVGQASYIRNKIKKHEKIMAVFAGSAGKIIILLWEFTKKKKNCYIYLSYIKT